MTGHDLTMPADRWQELKARVRYLYELAELRGLHDIEAAASDLYTLLIETEDDGGPIAVQDGQLALDWLLVSAS